MRIITPEIKETQKTQRTGKLIELLKYDMVAEFVRARDKDRSLRAPGNGETCRKEKKKR